MDSNKLTVLFSSDDNYAQHLGVAITSLLENNKCFESIQIYIIANAISDLSKKRIDSIGAHYANSRIIWVPFDRWKSQLKLNMPWNISISAYARLFVAEMLPEEVERVLYMDCDMVVCDSLYDLWNTDLAGQVLGAVQDTISDSTKAAVGLLPGDIYFNSGLLLVDLKEWRKQTIQERCLSFIDERKGTVIHHDQGVLNGVLRNKWSRLPLENNLMTIHFIFDRKQIMDYYGERSAFYSNDEILQAKMKPTILHYTPSFTSRPWCRDCKHPQKFKYWLYIAKTPWKDEKPKRSTDKWYVKLINWKCRTLAKLVNWKYRTFDQKTGINGRDTIPETSVDSTNDGDVK